MLFIDTVLAGLFFADDGTCETFSTKSACLTTSSLDQLDTLCVWTADNNGDYSCSFNEGIGQSAYSILILTTVIAVITVAFDAIFYFMLKKVKNLAEVSMEEFKKFQARKKITDAEMVYQYTEEPTKMSRDIAPIDAGLNKLQNMQTVLLRAARLVIIQNRTQGMIEDELDLIFKSCATVKNMDDIVLDAQGVVQAAKDRHDEIERQKQVYMDIARRSSQTFQVENALENQVDSVFSDRIGSGRVRPTWNKMFQDASMKGMLSPKTNAVVPIVESDGQVVPANSTPTVTMVEATPYKSYMVQAEYYVNDPGDPLHVAKRLASVDTGLSRSLMKLTLERARKSEKQIKEHMARLSTDDEKGVFLIQQFLVNCVAGIERKVAVKYFYHGININYDPIWERRIGIASAIILPMYIFALAFYVFLFGVSIGSKATDIWLQGAMIAVLQQIFILQPFRIWVTFVVLSSLADNIRLWHGLLRERSKHIMQRQHGIIRDAHALIQHINPACRAAQAFPHLPASRLLLSINDHDLPAKHMTDGNPSNQYARVRKTAKYAGFVVLIGVFLLTLLPETLQDVVLETQSTTVMQILTLVVYILSQKSVYIPVAIFFGLAIIIFLREYYAERRRAKAHNAVKPVTLPQEMIDDLDSPRPDELEDVDGRHKRTIKRRQLEALSRRNTLHFTRLDKLISSKSVKERVGSQDDEDLDNQPAIDEDVQTQLKQPSMKVPALTASFSTKLFQQPLNQIKSFKDSLLFSPKIQVQDQDQDQPKSPVEPVADDVAVDEKSSPPTPTPPPANDDQIFDEPIQSIKSSKTTPGLTSQLSTKFMRPINQIKSFKVQRRLTADIRQPSNTALVSPRPSLAIDSASPPRESNDAGVMRTLGSPKLSVKELLSGATAAFTRVSDSRKDKLNRLDISAIMNTGDAQVMDFETPKAKSPLKSQNNTKFFSRKK
jgi:hypothetical protein